MECQTKNMPKDDQNKSDNVAICVENLTVWCPEEYSWWRRKVTKKKSVILNNVTANLRCGEFAAILGPSGAGKTTFLVSMAGKCTLSAKGSVTINGRNVKEIEKKIIEIIPQFDVFVENLNVKEHLTFMTELKLGNYKSARNFTALNALISEMKLESHIKKTIRSLSGGERRLLSLASSLISKPKILLCDEPTSGLDSYNAFLVIEILKNISLRGKLVVCSVHQPSYDLFKLFNSILLMAEGKIMFHGSREECKDLFDSINLHCPINYNPAEFYIKAISPNANPNDSNIVKLLETYQNHLLEQGHKNKKTTPIADCQVIQRHWLKEVHLLLWRSSLTLKRSGRDLLIQLFMSIVLSSIVISICYIGISGTNQRGVQDMRGFLWLLSSEVCYSVSYNALFLFEGELTLFRREVGMYRGSAYFVATLLSLLPRCVIWPVFCVTVATLAVDLPNRVTTAFGLILSLIGAAIASTAYGLAVGALFTSTGLTGDIMPCMDLPLFLMSGAFLRISSLPFWLYPMKFMSHFYYVLDAVSNVYWRQIDYIDCPNNATPACYTDGNEVLQENGYSSDFLMFDSLGLLFVTLFWSILGYCGLKREERVGYAF